MPIQPGPRRWLLLGTTLLALASCTSNDGTACKVRPVALLDIRGQGTQGGLPLIDAAINGTPALLAVDTGAATSLLTDAFVARAHLSAGFTNDHVNGVGGAAHAGVVQVDHLRLGRGEARDTTFVTATGFAMHRRDGLVVDGLLGGDFLSAFDVSLDVPGRRIGLYRLDHCGDDMVPFAAPVFAVDFELDRTAIRFIATLDGKPVTMVLDSGASRTLITRDTATAVGVDAATLARDRHGGTIGIDTRHLDTALHRFQSFEFGAERLRDPVLMVADSDTDLMGEDVLRHNRVWISYPLRKLFFQPVAIRETP